MSSIERICNVEIENFKGFFRNVPDERSGYIFPFNTNADIVLLIGPNGYGKTSLLEALTMILTSHHILKGDSLMTALRPVQLSDDNQKDKISRIRIKTMNDSQSDTKPGQTADFELEWDREGKLYADKKPKGSTIMDTFLPTSFGKSFPEFLTELRTKRTDISELHARLCAFFQEKIEFQFDEAVQGLTLRGVLEPVPQAVKKLIGKLTEDKGEIEREIEKYSKPSSGKTDEDMAKEFQKESYEFMTYYNRLSKYNPKDWLAIPEPFTKCGKAFDFFQDVFEKQNKGTFHVYTALIPAFQTRLKDSIEEWIERAGKRAIKRDREGQKIEEELEKCKNEINKIHQSHPELEKEVHLFDPETKDDCDALSMFRTLARNAQTWSRVKLPNAESMSHELIRQVLTEFGRVDQARASEYFEILENWLKPKKEAWSRLEELEKEKSRLKDELNRYKVSEELKEAHEVRRWMNRHLKGFIETWDKACKHELEMKRQKKREEAAQYLRNQKEAAKCLLERIEEEAKVSRSLEEKFSSIIHQVARRFSFTDGMLPLNPVPCESRVILEGKEKKRNLIKIKSADEREMIHFSTGQKAQIGVSTLVAQNLFLSRYLPHRIILLDDVTTSYDLSNLTREAILWRQLAYGHEPGDERRRQIFISTHHEDLTNNLVTLLAPPHGCSLRLIQFTGWSKEKGPTYKQFEVAATAPEDPRNLENLARDLKDIYQ